MKPLAYISKNGVLFKDLPPEPLEVIALYEMPKPLSDEEIDSIIYSVDWAYDPVLLARAIEERHGIK